jgi:biotin carboxylase
VEHTVTEAVYDLDLVALQAKCRRARCDPRPLTAFQLHLSLFQRTFQHAELVHVAAATPRGYAIQARVSLERVLDPHNMSIAASGGCISAFDLPSGPGVKPL